MTSIFDSIFETSAPTISIGKFLLCIGINLLIGVFLAWVYSIRNRSTGSFLISVSLLPATVCIVIMMVNGNIGAGVAVAGAFALVRYRSAPGTAREISTLFIGMGAGLISGMGYLTYAVIFTVILSLALHFLSFINFGGTTHLKKDLRITIPEDINYSNVFDDIFKKYTSGCELKSVRTSNMGSLYKLHYVINLKDDSKEKDFIDELRTRNGNLEISIAVSEETNLEL